jgi:integrase
MKGGKPHRAPLSPRGIEILERAATVRSGDLIFPSVRTGSAMVSNVPLQFIRQTMNRHDLTIHGFRASFKTWAEERTNFDSKLIEAALAHGRDKLEEAYNRGDLFDKRRRLMDAWAAFVAKPAQNGKVIALNAERVAA